MYIYNYYINDRSYNVVEAHCYVGPMIETKHLSIECSKWIGKDCLHATKNNETDARKCDGEDAHRKKEGGSVWGAMQGLRAEIHWRNQEENESQYSRAQVCSEQRRWENGIAVHGLQSDQAHFCIHTTMHTTTTVQVAICAYLFSFVHISKCAI